MTPPEPVSWSHFFLKSKLKIKNNRLKDLKPIILDLLLGVETLADDSGLRSRGRGTGLETRTEDEGESPGVKGVDILPPPLRMNYPCNVPGSLNLVRCRNWVTDRTSFTKYVRLT